MQASNPLRIGQFTDTFLPIVDGVGRVVLSYSEELCRRGHEVTVVAPLYNTGYRGGYPFDLVDYMGYPVPTAKQYRTGTAATDSHYRARIKHTRLDLVHAHGPFSAGREAQRLARVRKIPLVATFHSKYYDDFYKATKSETISKLVLSNIISYYERCQDVWAVSESTADVLRGYGYKGAIRIMPNGVSPRQATSEALQALNEEYGLGDLPVLLFVGQINWKKNLLRVLEACALLKKAGQPFYLMLAGQGPDEQAVHRRAEELGLGDALIMTGHVSHAAKLDALYSRADLFVFPSLYDNAPMVVREASVMGTPSVLVRGSDAAEVIRDGQNGLLCQDDSADLSRVIGEALKDREALGLLGQSAQNTIPVPWTAIGQSIVDAYREILQNHSHTLANHV